MTLLLHARNPARSLLGKLRGVAGRWNMGRKLEMPGAGATGSKKTTILIVGIYLADRPNVATHLVQRFASAKTCDVTQRWVALNGEPDSDELARVTVDRLRGRVPKFTIVNTVLGSVDWKQYDYVLISDDDVTVSHGFLDAFIGYQRKHDFALAQPARTLWSRSSYSFVRQNITAEARLTRFVEIGPVFSMRQDLARVLLPFDEASPMGWGYDLVWPLQAEAAGLRIGIVDATPVDHCMRGQAAAYSGSAELQVRDAYLKSREHLALGEALVVLNKYSRERPAHHRALADRTSGLADSTNRSRG